MNTSRWLSRVVCAGALTALACSDSSAPSGDFQGVQFAYTGALSGHFRAIGPASAAGNPRSSFAVAFRTSVGEVQLCAYEAGNRGSGDFLLLNAGVVTAPGQYSVPPGWASPSTSYQPGTFLVGVDSTRTGVEHISPFVQGTVRVEELSATRVRGSFTVTANLTTLKDGQFNVLFAALEELPIICQ